MDWKKNYARKFIEEPIKLIPLSHTITKIVNQINNNFKEVGISQLAQFNKESKEISLPNCTISYEVSDTEVKFIKKPLDNAMAVNIFIKWTDGFYRISGGSITSDIESKMYQVTDELIDDVFRILLK